MMISHKTKDFQIQIKSERGLFIASRLLHIPLRMSNEKLLVTYKYT